MWASHQAPSLWASTSSQIFWPRHSPRVFDRNPLRFVFNVFIHSLRRLYMYVIYFDYIHPISSQLHILNVFNNSLRPISVAWLLWHGIIAMYLLWITKKNVAMIKDIHDWLWELHPDTDGCVHRQDLKGGENWTQDFLHHSRSPNNPVWQPHVRSSRSSLQPEWHTEGTYFQNDAPGYL